MFLLNWYKEYLEIKAECDARKRDINFCSACETLKLQLAIANDERKRLIDKLLEEPEVEETSKVNISDLRPLMPNRMNWNARRQILEAEDRAAAKLMRQNSETTKTAGSDKTLTVHEIEKELGVEENAS